MARDLPRLALLLNALKDRRLAIERMTGQQLVALTLQQARRLKAEHTELARRIARLEAKLR